MAEEDLRKQTKKGLYWSAAGNVANQGMRFVFGIILARLLSPDAYGIVGMLSIFMCIVSTFIDCGFSQALITKQDRTQKDFSTEFWFNIVVGIVGYLILFIASPFIADFYDMPILSPILKVIGLGVIINSLCVVQSAQLAIRLDFKTPAKISVAINVITGIAGIILAYYGWGVWSLVFQQVAGGVLNAICLWVIVRWIPTFEFSKESFKYLWNYGSKILITTLITQIYDNLYPLIIGKYFNSRELGLYSRAQGFATLPSSNLSNILGSVTFPILSKINNDYPRLRNVYRRMILSTGFIVFPLMIGLSAISSPLVKVLLNEQWNACIPYLQIMCLALIWQPISYLNINIIKVVQKTNYLLTMEVYKRTAGVLSIILSIPFGMMGICIGFALLYVFCFVLNNIYSCKALGISFKVQMLEFVPLFLNALCMGIIVYLITNLIDNDIIALFLGILVGAACYLISSTLFMKKVLKDTISLIYRK